MKIPLLTLCTMFCTTFCTTLCADSIVWSDNVTSTGLKGGFASESIASANGIQYFGGDDCCFGEASISLDTRRDFTVTADGFFELVNDISIDDSTATCSHGLCGTATLTWSLIAKIIPYTFDGTAPLTCQSDSAIGGTLTQTVAQGPYVSFNPTQEQICSGTLTARSYYLQQTLVAYGRSINFNTLNMTASSSLTDPPIAATPEPRFIAAAGLLLLALLRRRWSGSEPDSKG